MLHVVKILYFADIRFPLERANGIQTMETCHALARRGHDVHLVVRPDTHTPARDPFEYYDLPATPRLVLERAPVGGPALARRVGYLTCAAKRALGKGRADLVMTRDLAVASLLLRLPSRPPVVYESHGYAPEVASALPALVSTATTPSASKLARLARRESFVWRRADGYVTITSGLASAQNARFGARARVAVVPDGARVVPSGITDPPGAGNPATSRAVAVPSMASGLWPPASLTIAYAGHLYAWKGVDVLLEALAQVPGVRCLIAGGHDKEPDLARLQALAARLGVESRVTFTGHLPPSDVPGVLARADILALPNPASAISTHATSPLKLFEYMAAEKAIVASNLPAIREVLTHDVNALLVTPGDPGALAGAIRRLAGDPLLRETLAAAARTVVAEYSWDRRAERLEALFTEVRASIR